MLKKILLWFSIALVAGCGTTDKVLDNQQRQIELVASGGDASTDPINLNPKTMLAMPGSTGNDLEDYSTSVEERSHTPVAGDVFSAALTGGMNAGVTAENSAHLAELRQEVRMFRALWLEAVQDAEAPDGRVEAFLAQWNASKEAVAAYEAQLQEAASSRVATAAAMTPPQTYNYSPTKIVIVGALKGATADKSIASVGKVISAKRGEVAEDLDEDEGDSEE